MQNGDENVILFPKWETSLKDESLKDLQEKRYGDALEKMDALLRFNVQNHEILTGKIICLVELGRYEDAEAQCEEVLRNKDEHYYHYLHLYLTILFHTSKYSLLMELIEDELNSDALPPVLREQFLQLYDMSEKLDSDIKVDKSSKYIDELLAAVSQSNHVKQWQILTKLRTMKVEPDRKVVQLLTNPEVHPVINTAIFHWLQELQYLDEIVVHKMGLQMHVKPLEVPNITDHQTYHMTMNYLKELEQQNPTMYQFLEQLLYRFSFVRYPIFPVQEETEFIAKALIQFSNQLVDENYAPDEVEKVKMYLEQIIHFEQLYLSIIED
ncbi:tetratricopeptide repeat protein [Ornithinibacillus xuwenensis]|uniref:Tetratricopeptide repeat protein n=1 Tax=Ornithinibacillus xuwenensis TaxID=3144668 RepID=A0ABU9XBR8_9BACI